MSYCIFKLTTNKVFNSVQFHSRKKSHRLKRRKYRNKGPNHVWHMDGNDKLIPFGFYVHGYIDGFSRKIIWLHVANTNKDRAVIAYYFLKEVEVINGTATKITADLGSENSYVYGIQILFRRNDNDKFSGNRSFQHGKSTSNQRTESWWSIYKRDTIQKYLDYFKDLRDCGQYDDTDNVHVEALKFSFYGVIQDDLDSLVDYWNDHKIRTSKLSESPVGRPLVIYELPEKYDAEDHRIPVNTVDLNLAKRLYSAAPSQFCCSDEFSELALLIMEDLNLQIPISFKDAENLCFKLVEEIGKL